MREPRKDPKRLADILEAIDNIFQYVGNDDMAAFVADHMRYHAVVYNIMIIGEAANRLLHPVHIIFNEAILVAFIGLAVNAACIVVMETGHANDAQKHTDYNFKAAYYHILADMLTSVLAIAALVVGKYLGWTCLDALIGMLGGVLIVKWAISLLKDTVAVLIDMQRTAQ